MSPSAISESVQAVLGPSKKATSISGDTTHVHGSEDLSPLEALAHRQNSKPLPKIPTFSSFADHRQWQLEHMAGAFRVFAHEGYAEGISGHISVRDPEHHDCFWINPIGIHFGMLKASDMILINLDGEVVGGNREIPANAAGVHIHTAVHKARPDVHAICHTHSIHGRAWSAAARPLEMLNQDVCNFYNAHGVYLDYGGIALAAEEGANIAKALGQGKGAILTNHGLLTVGGTVDEAAFLFCLMERSCKVQLLVEASGIEKKIVADEEAAYNFKMGSDPETLYFEFQPHLQYEEFKNGAGFRD